jgi:hypothetical protein
MNPVGMHSNDTNVPEQQQQDSAGTNLPIEYLIAVVAFVGIATVSGYSFLRRNKPAAKTKTA